MAKTVVGLMDSPAEAQRVIQELIDCGFERSTIGVMASGRQGGDASAATSDDGSADQGEPEDRGRSALKGAGAGAALGGIAGLVVGLAALPIPGVGPIIAAGPIAAALAGAGIGAVAGGVVGALTDLGVPEHEAHYYAEGVRRGGTLLTVTAANDELADRAARLMREHGAANIEERVSQWKDSGWSGRSGQDTQTARSRAFESSGLESGGLESSGLESGGLESSGQPSAASADRSGAQAASPASASASGSQTSPRASGVSSGDASAGSSAQSGSQETRAPDDLSDARITPQESSLQPGPERVVVSELIITALYRGPNRRQSTAGYSGLERRSHAA
jgi:hypothetical protein